MGYINIIFQQTHIPGITNKHRRTYPSQADKPFMDTIKNFGGYKRGCINILNTITGKYGYLLPGTDNHSITSESVYAVYEDKMQEYDWHTEGGIISSIRERQFQTIAHEPLNPNSLISNFIFPFAGARWHLWVGTDGPAEQMDRLNNTFTNYKHIPLTPHFLK